MHRLFVIDDFGVPEMTLQSARELAEKIVLRVIHLKMGVSLSGEYEIIKNIESLLKEALKEARAEEREAWAKILDEQAKCHELVDSTWKALAESYAEMIRRQGER